MANAMMTSAIQIPAAMATSIQIGVPSLRDQWASAQFRVVADRATEAAKEANAARLRKLEEESDAAQRQHVEDAIELFQQEEEALRAIEEARTKLKEETERALEKAKAALELASWAGTSEDVELSAFPQIIAEAKLHNLDAETIAVVEQVYEQRALDAFREKRAEERLRRAVLRREADQGGKAAAGDGARLVQRICPVPLLPTVTTQVITLGKGNVTTVTAKVLSSGEEATTEATLIWEKSSKLLAPKFHEDDDAQSTAASDDQHRAAVSSAGVSEAGDSF